MRRDLYSLSARYSGAGGNMKHYDVIVTGGGYSGCAVLHADSTWHFRCFRQFTFLGRFCPRHTDFRRIYLRHDRSTNSPGAGNKGTARSGKNGKVSPV